MQISQWVAMLEQAARDEARKRVEELEAELAGMTQKEAAGRGQVAALDAKVRIMTDEIATLKAKIKELHAKEQTGLKHRANAASASSSLLSDTEAQLKAHTTTLSFERAVKTSVSDKNHEMEHQLAAMQQALAESNQRRESLEAQLRNAQLAHRNEQLQTQAQTQYASSTSTSVSAGSQAQAHAQTDAQMMPMLDQIAAAPASASNMTTMQEVEILRAELAATKNELENTKYELASATVPAQTDAQMMPLPDQMAAAPASASNLTTMQEVESLQAELTATKNELENTKYELEQHRSLVSILPTDPPKLPAQMAAQMDDDAESEDATQPVLKLPNGDGGGGMADLQRRHMLKQQQAQMKELTLSVLTALQTGVGSTQQQMADFEQTVRALRPLLLGPYM